MKALAFLNILRSLQYYDGGDNMESSEVSSMRLSSSKCIRRTTASRCSNETMAATTNLGSSQYEIMLPISLSFLRLFLNSTKD